MRLGGEPDLGHLTYCTNIHAGNTWPEVRAGLEKNLPLIRTEVAGKAPFGVGLRLSAAASMALQQPEPRGQLLELLETGNHYVFTLNGFPYGPFHGEQVKAGAYRPDWTSPARLTYTNELADLLADLLPEGLIGSISTVPGTFKPWAKGNLSSIAENLIAHVAHLYAIEARVGRHIALALEPEPCCLLETVEETIQFFNQYLFSSSACSRLAKSLGMTKPTAEGVLRRHLGICYDVCHAAVEFENPTQNIADLDAAGITIAKLQLSSAIRVPEVTPAALDVLSRFDEPVYLHQVVEKRGDQFSRYLDLPEAFAAAADSSNGEWRIHFHVPVFLEQLPGLGTTQYFLREILQLHRSRPLSTHLEVETYTWDVLPPEHRNVTVAGAIARELQWVKAVIEA